jgi:hypothetical protein
MEMKNHFALIVFWFTTVAASAQIGSLQDPDFVGLNNRLISLEFNGRIYAPRHGRLPAKEYKYKINT